MSFACPITKPMARVMQYKENIMEIDFAISLGHLYDLSLALASLFGIQQRNDDLIRFNLVKSSCVVALRKLFTFFSFVGSLPVKMKTSK